MNIFGITCWDVHDVFREKEDYRAIWWHLEELAAYAPVGTHKWQLYVVFHPELSMQVTFLFFFSHSLIFKIFSKNCVFIVLGKKWRKTKHLKELKLRLSLYSSPRLPKAGNFLAHAPAMPTQVSLLSPSPLSLPSVVPVLSLLARQGSELRLPPAPGWHWKPLAIARRSSLKTQVGISQNGWSIYSGNGESIVKKSN